jgi:hypothetical protein
MMINKNIFIDVDSAIYQLYICIVLFIKKVLPPWKENIHKLEVACILLSSHFYNIPSQWQFETIHTDEDYVYLFDSQILW